MIGAWTKQHGKFAVMERLAKADVPGLGPIALGLAIVLPAAVGLLMGVVLFYGRVVGDPSVALP